MPALRVQIPQVHESGLRGEELAKEMDKVNSWLQSQVTSVRSAADSADATAETVATAQRDFEKEADERVRSLGEFLGREDAHVTKFSADTKAGPPTIIGIQDLLRDAEATVENLADERKRLAGDLHRERESRTRTLDANIDENSTVTTTTLDAAEPRLTLLIDDTLERSRKFSGLLQS